jgi:hypothetical protein
MLARAAEKIALCVLLQTQIRNCTPPGTLACELTTKKFGSMRAELRVAPIDREV